MTQATWNYRLDSLFRAVAQVETPVGTVYLRVLSDAEAATREVQASLAEAEARAEFGENRAKAAVEAMTRRELEDLVLAARARQAAREALESFPPAFVPIPEGADAAERAAALEARRKAEEETARERTAYYEAKLTEIRKALAAAPDDELKAEALGAVVEAYARAAFSRAWERWTLYLAAFRDEGLSRRLWAEPEDVDRVPRSLREQLLKAYAGLEVYDPFRPDGDGSGWGGSGDA